MSYTIRIPYMLRELVYQLTQGLELPLGVPMNARLPQSTDEASEGKATLHFEGSHFVAKIVTRVGGYGQEVWITSIRCRIAFHSRERAEEWVEKLQRFAGPTQWKWEGAGFRGMGGGKLSFEIGEKSWTRLAMNASNRRNNLTEVEWDAPNP